MAPADEPKVAQDEASALRSQLDDVYKSLTEVRENLFRAQAAAWAENSIESAEKGRVAVASALQACHKHKICLQALVALLPVSPSPPPPPPPDMPQEVRTVPMKQGPGSPGEVTTVSNGGSAPTAAEKPLTSREQLGRAANELAVTMTSIDDVVRRGEVMRSSFGPLNNGQLQRAAQGPQAQHLLKSDAPGAGDGWKVTSETRWGQLEVETGRLTQARVTTSASDHIPLRETAPAWLMGLEGGGLGRAPMYGSLQSPEEYEQANAISSKIDAMPVTLDRYGRVPSPQALHHHQQQQQQQQLQQVVYIGAGGMHPSVEQPPLHHALEHVMSEYHGRSARGGSHSPEMDEAMGGVMLVQHDIKPGMFNFQSQQQPREQVQQVYAPQVARQPQGTRSAGASPKGGMHHLPLQQQQQQQDEQGGGRGPIPVQSGYSYAVMGGWRGNRQDPQQPPSPSASRTSSSSWNAPQLLTSAQRRGSSDLAQAQQGPQAVTGLQGVGLPRILSDPVQQQGVLQQQQQLGVMGAAPQGYPYGQAGVQGGMGMRMRRANPQQFQVASAFRHG